MTIEKDQSEGISTSQKLQEIDECGSSFCPLILKESKTGLVAHGENKAIAAQLLWSRAVLVLKQKNICMRNGLMFDWRKRAYLHELPGQYYEQILKGHDYLVARKKADKEKSYEYSPVKDGSLKDLSHTFPASGLKKRVEESLALPELRYENELTGEEESGEFFVPKVVARYSQEDIRYAENLFSDWVSWMSVEAKDQLDFFCQIARGYLFANRVDVAHEAKINFGVGPNRSGKGLLINFLESIPNLSDIASWQPTDCASEYRHGSIFREKTTLSVCHEWRDLPRQDNFIALIKQAVRREPLTVREVGSKVRQIVCPSEFVIFFNSAHGDNRDSAIDEAYQMLAKWDAYDRMNVVFVDWSRRYPRFAEIDRILRSPRRGAWGLAVYAFACSLQRERPVTYPIPTDYAAARSDAAMAKWERALIGICETIIEIAEYVEQRRGELISITEYREGANLLARQRLRQMLKRESADSFLLSERNGEIFYGVNIKWLNAALRQLGAPARWRVPSVLTKVIEKEVDRRVHVISSGWNFEIHIDEARKMGL